MVVGGYPANHESGPGWRLIWSGNPFASWLGPLPALLGLHRSIAEFTEARGLAEYADTAADYGVEICACSIEAAQAVVEVFRTAGSASDSTDLLQIDPTCLFWSHVAESDDWSFVTVRCGTGCPADLIQAIKDIESW